MTSESMLLYLIGTFLALVLTVKIGGAIGFWVCSYILGNKLAALLEEDASDSERQEATRHSDAPPWKVPQRQRQHSHRQRSAS